MAEVDESFVFPAQLRTNGRYPWHEWLDGQTWKLVANEDFKCRIKNFRQMAVQASLRLDMKGEVNVYIKDDIVWVRFVKAEET